MYECMMSDDQTSFFIDSQDIRTVLFFMHCLCPGVLNTFFFFFNITDLEIHGIMVMIYLYFTFRIFDLTHINTR